MQRIALLLFFFVPSMALAQERPIKIEVTQTELHYIASILAAQPYKDVAGLLQKLSAQVQAQQESKKD